MLYRLLFVGLICTILGSSCGVKSYLGREVAQAVILESVKENGLLIRLRSEEARVEAMRKYGKDEKADVFVAELNDYNSSLIEAIKKNYDFSEVYFYYSRDAEAIFKQNDFSGIVDINLAPIKADFSERPGVLLTERYDMTLHRWDEGRMVELDKMVYPRYSFRFFTLAFAKPSIKEVMLLSIPLMNSDFHNLYALL